MPVTIRSGLALAMLGSLSIATARAEERDTQQSSAAAGGASAECVQTYERAQEQRHSGKLLEARVQLASCARDICPEFIRNDCASWYGEVQAETPTVVMAARSDGRDLTDVRVSLGGRVLASRIDGEAIELDPGEYAFGFSAPGMHSVTQHVLISRGERNRLLRAELVPLGTAQPPADRAATSLPSSRQRSWLLPGVLGGVAVLGLSSFVAFGTWGHATESRLESTCSPNCSADQISSVRAKYTAADVSLAVAAVSLGFATYFALSSSSEQRPAHASPFDVQVSTRGVTATYQEAF